VFPYLDAPGYVARSIIASADLATFQGTNPGFIDQRIATRSSWLNAQARKRYGNNPCVGRSVPFGQAPPALLAAGTSPPPIVLSGRPVLGSLEIDLAITTPGSLGSALFQWSANAGASWAIGSSPVAAGSSPPAVTFAGLSTQGSPSMLVVAITAAGALGTALAQYSGDGGASWTISPNPVASGTSPPLVTFSGLSTLALPQDLVVEITTAGPLQSAIFQYSVNGGSSWTTNLLTAPSVPIPGTGLTVNFGAGQYSVGNTYTGQGLPTAPSFALSPYGITATMAAGTYQTGTTYTGQGIATAAAVVLPGTGLTAAFAAGAYGADNVYSAPTPVPEVILGWLATLLDLDVMRKRGVNPQDPLLELMVESVNTVRLEVQDAVDGKDGLWDIPTNEDADSAVTTGGPMCYSESSPYVYADSQEREGVAEDLRGRGTQTER
jgi:hypothetical protein